MRNGFFHLVLSDVYYWLYMHYTSLYLLQIAMWATELFFQFGGEPHFVFPTTAAYQSPQVAQASPQITSPSVYGTPGASYVSPSVLGRAIMGPELVMSGRHQGLCLYLARLIRSVMRVFWLVLSNYRVRLCRPFWNAHVVTVSSVPGQKEVQVYIYSMCNCVTF